MGLFQYVKNPRKLILPLGARGWFNWLPDEVYLKQIYKAAMGKPLNLEQPKTYNEKLQWLKLHDRRPEYTQMVDKHDVKTVVAQRIGEEYVVPTLGVWERFDDIDFSALPRQFVLKCTHDSGGLVICRDKEKLDLAAAKKKINRSLRRNFYLRGREWSYKGVKPRIIAEQYLEDPQDKELRDYKFFCFDGRVKALFVAVDRALGDHEVKFDFFDENYCRLNVRQGHPNAKKPPHPPVNFEKMKELAEKLSAGIPHVRVDFYEVAGKIYFGEMTFYHFNGVVPFEPPEWDTTFGQWLRLPSQKTED